MRPWFIRRSGQAREQGAWSGSDAYRVVAAGLLLTMGLLIGPSSPSGGYSAGGYDVSYPNCRATSYPGGFAIVGVGGGRPFTANHWA